MEAKYDDEKITGVAIRINGTFISLRPPYRHNSLFPVLAYLGYNPPYNDEQGFVTSNGRFVTREEAWKIADARGKYYIVQPDMIMVFYSRRICGDSMKLVLISDTHNKHRQLVMPDGDVLIHAGDSTMSGNIEQIQNFGAWMGEQTQYKMRILIAGNHDWRFEKNLESAKRLLPENITYLQDESIEFEGVKFYGSPWQPRFYNWAFNVDRGPLIAEKWKAIPDDTNVLITHGPPFGTMDSVPDYNDRTKILNVGCEELAKRTAKLKDLKLHVFGHIHEHHGVIGNMANASSLDGRYSNPRLPIVFEI